jgi:hypothetical protein
MLPKKHLSGFEKRKKKNELLIEFYRQTVPVTLVASAERSFSKLKLIKTYLRSSISQERLNGLTTLSIEKDMLADIDVDVLINDFVSQNARRNHFL